MGIGGYFNDGGGTGKVNRAIRDEVATVSRLICPSAPTPIFRLWACSVTLAGQHYALATPITNLIPAKVEAAGKPKGCRAEVKKAWNNPVEVLPMNTA